MARSSPWMIVALASMAALAFVGPSQGPRSGSVALRAGHGELPETTEPQNATSIARTGGAFFSMIAALALVLLPVEAEAAKSGGRIGGTASAARSKPPPRAPAAASTTTNKTVINETTVIAPPPPVVAAPSMGMGIGVAPVVVAPPPTLGDVVVGTVIGGAINNAISGGEPQWTQQCRSALGESATPG